MPSSEGPTRPLLQKHTGNARILIVEDNVRIIARIFLFVWDDSVCLVQLVNYKVFARWLNDAGYTTSVANNGIEALELLDKQTFDIILMVQRRSVHARLKHSLIISQDCQMPLMDGFACTQCIREKENKVRGALVLIYIRRYSKSSIYSPISRFGYQSWPLLPMPYKLSLISVLRCVITEASLSLCSLASDVLIPIFLGGDG